MADNYYTTLKVGSRASPEEIKKAYRSIAFISHPDKQEHGSDLFKKATEAYKILSEKSKRKEYDDLLEKKHSIKSFLKRKRGSNLLLKVKVEMKDIVRSNTIKVETNRKGLCSACKGTGSDTLIRCNVCNGRGIEPLSAIIGPKKPCHVCGGEGFIAGHNLCSVCKGLGTIPQKFRENLNLNPLITGHIIIKNKGNYCKYGDPGDLIIEVVVKKDKIYSIYGLNIKRSITISPAQAVLGDEFYIDVFGRSALIRIPPGTQSGFLVEGKRDGIQYGNRVGKLITKIIVEIPEPYLDKIFKDGRLRKLYEQILNIEREKLWRKV